MLRQGALHFLRANHVSATRKVAVNPLLEFPDNYTQAGTPAACLGRTCTSSRTRDNWIDDSCFTSIDLADWFLGVSPG